MMKAFNYKIKIIISNNNIKVLRHTTVQYSVYTASHSLSEDDSRGISVLNCKQVFRVSF